MRTFLVAITSLFLVGCSSINAPHKNGLQTGSIASKNLFIDSSQFANRKVKLRLRNSSGDSALDVGHLRSSIEMGLKAAGYEIADQNFGIVVDVNAFHMQTVFQSSIRNNSALAGLVGGVAGYEVAKKSGGVSSTSGAILGVVAGVALEEVLRKHNERATYIALCDVNIGVVRKEFTKKDRFVVGGNKIEHKEPDEADTFANFAYKDTVRLAVFAGDDPAKANQTVDALVDRLGRIIANLL